MPPILCMVHDSKTSAWRNGNFVSITGSNEGQQGADEALDVSLS